MSPDRYDDDDPVYGWAAQIAPFPPTGPADSVTFGDADVACYKLVGVRIGGLGFPCLEAGSTTVGYAAHYDPAGTIDAVCYWYRERVYDSAGAMTAVADQGVVWVRPDRRRLGIGAEVLREVRARWGGRGFPPPDYSRAGRALHDSIREDR